MVMPPCLLYVTAPSEEEARRIGEKLIEERLVACVNIFPIRSIYRWEGKTCREEEFALILKTNEEVVDRAIARLKELHPYKVPCILKLPVAGGLEEFVRWIEESTA